MNNAKYSRYYTFVRPIFRSPVVKTYNSFALSLVIITVFALFAIKPTLGTIASLRKDIDQQQQVLDQLNAKAKQASLAKSNLDSMTADQKTKLDDLLPSKTDPGALAESLIGFANQYDASVSGMVFEQVDLVGEPPEGSSAANLSEIDFTFNLTGSYPNLVAILDALKSSTRLVYLNTVNMAQDTDTPLKSIIEGKAYFLK